MTILHSSSGRPYCTTDAKVQVVLPQLSELRLISLTKQLSRNRKQLYLTQGNLKTELKVTKRHIEREHKLADDRHAYVSAPFRKSLSHVKGVQKCLLRRKTEMTIEKSNDSFGDYGGLSVKSLKNEIDRIMKDNDYQHVKMRYCRRILQEGRADGRIMNVNLSIPLLETILSRPSMPRRRERALGFESPEEQSPEPTSVVVRQPRTNFRLPPVTATRLYTPKRTQREVVIEVEETIKMDRANTIA